METSQLICKANWWAGFYMVFIVQTDYSIALISEAVIAKYPFDFCECGDFILGGFVDFSL